KSRLLAALSELFSRWPGNGRLSRRQVRRVDALLVALADCELGELEFLRHKACQTLFERAAGGRECVDVRHLLLLEIWCWQELLAAGEAVDERPRRVPNPDFGKGAIEMQWHRWPLPRPLA